MKVTIDGEVHEVDQSDIDTGDLKLVDPSDPPQGLFNQNGVDAAIQNRIKGLHKPDELLEDEDFQKKVLSKFDIQLDESGKPKGVKSADDDEAKYKAWADKHLKPKEEEIQTLQSKISKQNGNLVGAKVEGLVSKFLDPIVAKSPIVVKGLKDSFGYHDETGGVVPLQDDGTPYRHGNGSVMTPEEWFEHETKQGSLKDMAIDNRPGSNGFQGGSNEGNVVTISEADAKDASKFEAAESQAKESGAELKITD